MQLNFQYNINKEFDNFRRCFASINHIMPSPRQKDFFERYSKLTPENVRMFVQEYIAANEISITEKISAIQAGWRKVESNYFKRADAVYRTTLPVNDINVYLTILDRCSYSFEQNEFFVHLHLPYVNKTIMHELWHWYFYYTVGREIKETKGQSEYNNVKEALTVLLNEEFSDLLQGVVDRGYPQHANLRQQILDIYRSTKDIYLTIQRSLTIN